MKRLVCLLLAFTLILTGCQNQITLGDKQVVTDTFTQRVSEIVKYKDNGVGSRLVGGTTDLELLAYLESEMKKIGLQTVTRDEIILDGWNYKGATISFKNSNGDNTTLDIGAYPVNMQYLSKLFRLKVYDGNSAAGTGVLLFVKEGDSIAELVHKAEESGAVLAVLVTPHGGVTIEKGIKAKGIGVISIPEVTGNYLKKQIESHNGEFEITLNIDNTIIPDIKTANLWGEIPGKDKHSVIYVTANRDSLFSGFHGNATGVAELLAVAETMVKSRIKPDKTIRFLITTGQEWGKAGEGQNQGIATFLDKQSSEALEPVFTVLNLDGCKPLPNQIKTSMRAINAYEGYLVGYNTQVMETEYKFLNKVQGYDNRVTEDTEWLKRGIPVILQAEPNKSVFVEFENTPRDNETLGIDESQVTFLVKYYTNLILDLDKLAVRPLELATMLNTQDATLMQKAQALDKEVAEYNKTLFKSSKKSAALNKQQQELLKDIINR